jgi:hypothetical protein
MADGSTPTPRRPQSRWNPPHPGSRVAAGVRTASPRAIPYQGGSTAPRSCMGGYAYGYETVAVCSTPFLFLLMPSVQRRAHEQEEEPDEEGDEDLGEVGVGVGVDGSWCILWKFKIRPPRNQDRIFGIRRRSGSRRLWVVVGFCVFLFTVVVCPFRLCRQSHHCRRWAE